MTDHVATCTHREENAGTDESEENTSLTFMLVLLGALTALGPLAIDMYLPSFPAIAEEFGVAVSSVERTLAAYFVGMAIGQLFYGPAADRLGRKLPLYGGLTLFLLASIGCALAGSVKMLIVVRFLQALGACSTMVVARAVIRDCFEERDAARAFSTLILVVGGAPMIAPLVGGWLTVHLGWRAIFAVLIGASLLCLVAAALFLRETLPHERRRRDSLSDTLAVYFGLLRHRSFMVHTLAGSLASASLFAYVAGSPFVFIEVFGVDPSRFGLFFSTNALGLVAASQVNGYLAHRIDPRRTVRVALIFATAAGGAIVLAATTGIGGFAGLLAPLFLFVGSLGFILPTSTALAMEPHKQIAGNASAMYGFLQFLLSAAGGMLVSSFHTGSAAPMALILAGCVSAALAINLACVRSEIA